MQQKNPLVKGWLVYEAGKYGGTENHFFLDLNNAMAYCDHKRPGQTLMVQPQYMHLDKATDLHKSRLRRAVHEYER